MKDEEKDLMDKIEGMTKEEKTKYFANQLADLSVEFELPLNTDGDKKETL